MTDQYPRAIGPYLQEAIADTRVVLVNGARQSGKSTLSRSVDQDAIVRLLDDPAVLASAQLDPVNFCEHEGLMLIDEIQLYPELVRAIKLVVDHNPQPGQFLLTGSANVLALASLPDAMPGRMETIELWPLGQCEIEGTLTSFVDQAFNVSLASSSTSSTTPLKKRDYLERATRGGFPEAVKRTTRRRSAFFQSYLTSLIARDVLQISDITRHGELLRILQRLASQATGLFVPNRLAQQTGIARTTLQRYLGLLESVFLIKRIPAWSAGPKTRAIGTPKLIFVDTGILGHLLGQDAGRLLEPDGMSGPILENFVISEIARHQTWAETNATLFHFRNKDGVEVDAVLETPDGRIVGIEVKASSTVRPGDLKGLRHLAKLAPKQFVAGYVLYCGQQVLPLGDQLYAVPIDALWMP